jgi:hypothetical protein
MLSLLRRFNVVLEYSGWLICTGLLLSFSIIAIPQEVLPLPVSTQFNSVTDQTNNENETSLICNGSLTFHTTTTIQWTLPVVEINDNYHMYGTPLFVNMSWMSFVEKRSSTITIPFTVNLNHTYTGNGDDPEGRIAGDIWGWSNNTISWIGDWSITDMSGCSRFIYNAWNFTHSFEYIPTSVIPGSGNVSGSSWVEVTGLYRNGQVFFNFNPNLHNYRINGSGDFENYIYFTYIDGALVPENSSLPDSPMVWRYETYPNQGSGWEVWDPTYDGMNALWLASGGVGREKDWMTKTLIKSDLGDSADLEIPISGECDYYDFYYATRSIDPSHIRGGHMIFEYSGMVNLKVGAPTPLANITWMLGTVEINTGQGNTWESAVEGSALRNGDRVRTGEDARAIVMFNDGSSTVLEKNGSYKLEGYKFVKEQTTWEIIKGKCFIKWLKWVEQLNKKFNVRAGPAIGGIQGTEFTVEVTEDNATTFTVFEGSVNVQDRISGSNVTVAANQTLTVHPIPGGLTKQEMSALITTVDPASIDRWWRAPTELSCSVSKNTITQGDGIVVSGSINVSLSGKTVTLTYKKPDESILNRTVTTGSDGSYSDSYTPDAAGTWSVTASWTGDSTHNGATSSTRSLTVNSVTFILFTPLGMALTGGIILLAVIVVLLILRRRPKIPGNTLSFFRVVDTFANYHSFTYFSY